MGKAAAKAPAKAAAKAPAKVPGKAAGKGPDKAAAAQELPDQSYQLGKVERYSNQSYIRAHFADQSKSLLIACNSNQSLDHGQVVEELHQEAQKHVRRGVLFRASKELLKAKRKQLLEEDLD